MKKIDLVIGLPFIKNNKRAIYIYRAKSDKRVCIRYGKNVYVLNTGSLEASYYDRNSLFSHISQAFAKRYSVWLSSPSLVAPNNFALSLKKMHKIFKQAIEKWFILPYLPYAKSLCMYRQGPKWLWNFHKLNNLALSYNKIKQADKDGIFNIAPFILSYGKTPKELKSMFGKSLWKKLSHNSFSRNKLIEASNLFVGAANVVPSTVLKNEYIAKYTLEGGIRYNYGIYIRRHNGNIVAMIEKFFIIWKNSKFFYKNVSSHYMDIYLDMMDMGAQLNKKPNPKTMGEVEVLHERYTKEIMEREDSRTKDTTPVTQVLNSFKIGEYICTPLTSAADLYKEGKIMHHCIYSYLDRIKEQEYYAVHIENLVTKEVSTLGINVYEYGNGFDENAELSIDQHLGIQNTETNNDVINRQVLEYLETNLCN